MKLIKVRSVLGEHPIYKEIIAFPPPNVKYTGISKKKGEKYYQTKRTKEALSRSLHILKLPRMIYLPRVNEDLIHSSRGILILNKMPWVIDVEHPYSFTGLSISLLKNKFTKNIIEKSLASNYCKKIMPHCEASKKAMFNTFDCSKFKNKIEVVYPATHILKIKKNKHKNIRILSVLSLFYEKGGLQTIEAFSRLEKKYKNIELWIKSDVPEEVRKRYSSKNIKYFPYKVEILSREKLLQKYYANCDIFLYPSFVDTFGYSLIDAMVGGLPIVASNIFAIPELVENNKNGFIIKAPVSWHDKKFLHKKDYTNIKNYNKIYNRYANEIVKKLSILIENKKLREKMGQYSFKLVSEGKFSINERNKKLRRIYEGSIK
jgi:glycosyltransferase involved in cell wall biosynthesis